MARKLARRGSAQLLLLAARGEGVFVDVALHVGEMALHQLLCPLALARGDCRGDVVVEVGIDGLALEAMRVLAERRQAASRWLAWRESNTARKSALRATSAMVRWKRTSASFVARRIRRRPGLAGDRDQLVDLRWEARNAASRAITGSMAKRTSITSSGLVWSRILAKAGLERRSVPARTATPTARTKAGPDSLPTSACPLMPLMKVPRPWCREIGPRAPALRARGAANGGRPRARSPANAPAACGRRHRRWRSTGAAW